MIDWLFVPVFLGLWAAVCLGIAHLGWARLAKRYRSSEPFDAEKRYCRSAQVGSSSYRSCLTIGARPWGLHLSVLFPFRLGHPPLLIPWGDITGKETAWLLGRGYALQFRQVPGLTMKISNGLGEALQSDAGSRWPKGDCVAAFDVAGRT